MSTVSASEVDLLPGMAFTPADPNDPNDQVGGPTWWLRRLSTQLMLRRQVIGLYRDYYGGEHRAAFHSPKFRRAFGSIFSGWADNWCALVVDAVGERLRVEGFRMTEDPQGDKDAWDIWQRNFLDNDSGMVHTEALVSGMAYAIVWPGDDGQPLITVEDPWQTIVAFDPARRRQRVAGLKLWLDDDESLLATVYLPDGLYKYRFVWGTSWAIRETPGEPWPLPNPLGVVPVVEFANRPRLSKPHTSELHDVIPQQDFVNKLCTDLLVAAEFAAYRQRWATGLEVPTDPVTGELIEPFRAAVDRLWISENPDAKFGEFEATGLQNYVTAIEMMVQHLAAQTSTPPHYFYLKGQFPSGESIKSAETPLVAKVRGRMRSYEESWEEVIRLAFAVLGDERANAYGAQTIWADPEYRTEGEHVDSLTKLQAIGVPPQQLWEDAGYSPQQIARFESMRARNALMGVLNTAALTPPVAALPAAPVVAAPAP